MRAAPRKSRAKIARGRAAPNTVNGTVPPRLVPYSKRRQREYLTVKEVGLLIDAARERGRYGRRDATMILIAYRHGLRSTELCTLRWDQVDFGRGLLHVRRIKNGFR
jgi:type 1 fimbriae regulatory protein FimE